MPNPTTTVQVKIPHLSGFEKSVQRGLTSKVGTITPAFFDEVIPNSRVHQKMVVSASLPPLASDVMMKASIRFEAFFCPHRLACKSFEAFFSQENISSSNGGQSGNFVGIVPTVDISDSGSAPYLGPGTLTDYLGGRFKASDVPVSGARLTALPYLEYHLIYDWWYRRSDIQKPVFVPRVISTEANTNGVRYAPSTFYSEKVSGTASPLFADPVWPLNTTLTDSVHLGELRQRNFATVK